MSAITDVLPVEILHEIVSFIDSPSDVLSFGLSNKALADISIPHPCIYRVFRARISRSAAIWRFFAQADLTAGEVRELDILPENISDVCHGDYGPDRWMAEPLVVPKELAGRGQIQHFSGRPSFEQTRADEVLLIDAVKRMKNLKRFGWYRSPPPVIVDQNDLWHALGSSGSLEELDVVDEPFSVLTHAPAGYIAVKPLASTETFLSLRGLKTLTICTHAYDQTQDEVDFTGIVGMLAGNKDLEKLHLFLKSPITMSITALIITAQWNHLRSLNISGRAHCIPSALLGFLHAHPGIEELSLAPLIIGKRWFQKPRNPPSKPLLPHLKRLQCKAFHVVWLVEHGAGSRVTELTGVLLSKRVVMNDVFFDDPDELDENDEGDIELDQSGEDVPSPFREPFLDILKSNRLPSLTHLGVRGDSNDLEDVVAAFPHIRELTLDFWVREVRLDEFLPHLARLPLLNVFKAPELFEYDRYHLYKHPNYDFIGNATRVCKLAKACPLLERIVFEKIQIVLIRGGSDGLKWVFRKLGDNEPVMREGEDVRYASDLGVYGSENLNSN
ncbi:hypothetical protein GGU10DRAFT_386364 [Lentinula aff. detonsa]|uniref:F-box domain-containing protein n=1 Tax=Lentinula aff. detonsa TaxID=2804958 RepID=A0AA38KAT7_9AGAR|nr:hypothetical protein GGU10DRAFT_386364 [Lentinula aff. detonsa]